MKISSAEVIVTSPTRNFVTLKLTTDDGITGLGDATVNGRELAAAAYLRDHVAPLLPGRDPHQIEDTWQYLYRGAYWRRGPITMAAIAAVDMALWDIKGKIAGLPVYQLLGGASRNGLLAYGHASGNSQAGLFESIHEHLERGYRAIRVQTSVPGIRALYGVAAQPQASGERYDYEPAGRGVLPVEEDWDTAAYIRHVPTVFEAVRGVRRRAAAATRRSSSSHADRGREARKAPGALRPLLARGLHARREPAGAPAGAPTHHHAAGDR